MHLLRGLWNTGKPQCRSTRVNLKWQYFKFTNIRSHYFMLSWSHYQPLLTILWWVGPSHQPSTCSLTPPSSSRTGERIGKPKARKLVDQGKECSVSEGKRGKKKKVCKSNYSPPSTVRLMPSHEQWPCWKATASFLPVPQFYCCSWCYIV